MGEINADLTQVLFLFLFFPDCHTLKFMKVQCKAFLFLFVGVHHLPRFDFGKLKKIKKLQVLENATSM